MPTTLKTHRFSLILRDVAEISDALEDATLNAGCDDALLWSRDGVAGLDFDREAETLGDAIGSAVKAIESAGFAVARVDVA
jgi:hypothetical protein